MSHLPAILRTFESTLDSASIVEDDGLLFFTQRVAPRQRALCVVTPEGHSAAASFAGTAQAFDGAVLLECPLTTANARALRERLPWLRPVPLGLATSAGCGDRLGLATPGHVRAFNAVGGGIAPIFAQQSIREMVRTNRTPDDVMTDATFGALQAGWRAPVGADADHLKTTADIDACLAAGFSFFTLDPSAHVNDAAAGMTSAALDAAAGALDWAALDTSRADFMARYADQDVHLGDRSVRIDALDAVRAAVKYGAAIAHVRALAAHLASKAQAFDLEVSVDETEAPTTPAEHIIIAGELRRLGVSVVSLAPRFVGRFEKGVDFIGDLVELHANLSAHAAIARAMGPYKLSLHSGSDKFSVYPLITDATDGLVHLKTAGTSYLEALRVIAAIEPAFFREILDLGRERYPTDRATYHVSAELERVPAPEQPADPALPGLLDAFDARQVLHVTFGSALARFGPRIHHFLADNAEAYAAGLERHFVRHLAPFARV